VVAEKDKSPYRVILSAKPLKVSAEQQVYSLPLYLAAHIKRLLKIEGK